MIWPFREPAKVEPVKEARRPRTPRELLNDFWRHSGTYYTRLPLELHVALHQAETLLRIESSMARIEARLAERDT